MITRDRDTGNIIITPEDIPAIRGLIGSSKERLEADVDKIPLGFRGVLDVFLDAARRFDAAGEALTEDDGHGRVGA